MATLVLSAAGAAVGGSIGGTFAGLSSVAIGRAVGATIGRAVDQKLLGSGGQVVETGRVDRFRLTGAGEGAAIGSAMGLVRVGGHLIWTSGLEECVTTTGGGGKGSSAAPQAETREYTYKVNLAIALGEGEISRVGRVWADGEEISKEDLNMSVYPGAADQLPDPTMEAIEGPGQVPAYRGTAYVVMQDLILQQFGNRIPQFSFEISRPEQRASEGGDHALAHSLQGVALIPGTGEYSLATTPVNYVSDGHARWSANVSTPSGKPDFSTSLECLTEELQALKAASLVVSWFGGDLRCNHCQIQPKIENALIEGENMPWSVSGLTRSTAEVIVQKDDRPIYGGTPTDASVVEAIQAMNAAGKAVMFYPFILMDQLEDNVLPNPYSDTQTQPKLPWRGRITSSVAAGQNGSPDGTAVAAAEVDTFFGNAAAADFIIANGEVTYSGPNEWGLNRFILHYAALCKAAGGVDAFCIGSEMRALTYIRGANNSFPAVARFKALAAEVRSLLGPDTKISYAADWSEYFGYQPSDGSGDVFFHLDPLWSDPNIDFIGIDNYMPLSDWRDGSDHLDIQNYPAEYDLDYLKSNIQGGEGFDWYYASPEDRDAQIRAPISDGAHNEPWVYRYKDIHGWWSNLHNERVGGQRIGTSTDWVPGSKPIWFTEFGCSALDKGANQPNKFLDLQSSESALPFYSSGARDDLMQMQYLRATVDYWGDPANNPDGFEYDGPMVEMSRAFVWAWDVRPFPFFPNNLQLWSDGESYARGHWINGRTSSQSLAAVVADICERSGITRYDVSELFGYVRGYTVNEVTDGRTMLQPLMLRFGFDAIERDGVLKFRLRNGLRETQLVRDELAVSAELDGITVQSRESFAELSGRVRLRFVQADGNYDVISEEAVLADEATHAVATSEMNLALTRAEGRQVAERWLTEARVAREAIQLALPPSKLCLGAGDVIELTGDQLEGPALYRIDRVEQTELQQIEAVRIEPKVYDPAPLDEELVALRPFFAPVPVTPFFLDLPLLRGDEAPVAPYVAADAGPWPGSVALYSAPTDANYGLNTILPIRAVVGETLTPLFAAQPGLIDNGPDLEVKLTSGQLESVDMLAVLNGANLAVIGDGSADNWEVLQFQEVQLLAPQQYLIRTRLRGQAGSDGIMPPVWPAGSKFMLLNEGLKAIELSPNLRGVSRNYRIGPAQRGVSDPSFTHLERAFAGNGLRPYRPAHLNADKLGNGDYTLTWVRRTRQDGDPWEGLDVPLAEDSESYLLRVVQNGVVLRETVLGNPQWTYSISMQANDGAVAPFDVKVAQVSASYGPGPAAELLVTV